MGSVSRRVATGEVMSALSGADFFQKHVFLASVRIKGPDHASLYFLTPLRHACESSTTIVTMDWFVDAVLGLRQNVARIDMKIEGRYRFAQGWTTFLRPTHLLETSLLTMQLIALILLHKECRSYLICPTNCKI